MGVRLLSSIFGKNPSPSPAADAASPPPLAKSPVAKARMGSFSKELPESERKTDVKSDGAGGPADSKPADGEDSTMSVVSKRAAAASSKIGIGVTGNVLAEMKARQERRISGIMKQNSEESDFSERSEKPEPKASLSPNPIGGVRLRPTPLTPEESDPCKTENKMASNPTAVRFGNNRPVGTEEAEPERNKAPNPITAVRLRPRGVAEEGDAAVKPDEKSTNPLGNIRLRVASSLNEDSDVSEKSESKSNPLSGVRLRSTGINVTDPLKSPNNSSNGESESKSESRNSLTKLKPPPLAPKPRPWSVVGSDKKNGELDTF